VGELRTINVQETSSRQKADRLPEVGTFGVVVPSKYVLQRLRVREHKDIFLSTPIIQVVSNQHVEGQPDKWNEFVPRSILLRARRSRIEPSI